MPTSATWLTVGAAVAATSVVAYAVYFDYKRRNDLDFRHQLKKQKRKAEKASASSTSSSQEVVIDDAQLQEAVDKVKQEKIPAGIEEREQYFMGQVSIGEQLATLGPSSHLPAALSFFRALRVYPAPTELIIIYEKTVPPPIFNLVVRMMSMDVRTFQSVTGSGPSSIFDLGDETRSRSGPPSETSSPEWEHLSDSIPSRAT